MASRDAPVRTASAGCSAVRRAIGYLFLLVAWPVSLVVKNTFADGLADLQTASSSDPDVVHALQLTVDRGGGRGGHQHVFGVGISLLLVRYEFPGKRVLSTLIDLPLSVSPIVVGLALVLVYGGRDGWFGPAARRRRLPGHLRHARASSWPPCSWRCRW